MLFNPVSFDLLFTRNDPEDPRLGEIVKSTTSFSEIKGGAVIAGYPDDEGIRLNGGRVGAAQAPDSIRRSLYRMTPHLHQPPPETIWDVGNLSLNSLSLAERHQQVRRSLAQLLDQNVKWLGLGGGHDYGYADGAGFVDWCQKQNGVKPLIINFDAHLDVRPASSSLNSGTPFYRLLNEFNDVELLQIGIQSQCNSRTHLSWAIANGAKVLSWDEIEASSEPFAVTTGRFLEPYLLKRRPVFVSVDIDGFNSSYAMGCSQSWPLGFIPNDWFPVFELLCRRLDVRVLGIYEVSPPLDMDQRTAKLAALIAHRWLSLGFGV